MIRTTYGDPYYIRIIINIMTTYCDGPYYIW